MAIVDLDDHISKYLETYLHHKCNKCGHTNVWESAKRLRAHGEKGPYSREGGEDRTGIQHAEHHILSQEEAAALGLDNYYARWSTEMDDLILMIREGKTVEEIAKLFKRTKNSVNTKIYQLDLRDLYIRVQNGEIQKGESDERA